MQLTDLHCHLLPYVDDGAATMDEALELLAAAASQGVVSICLTPHLRTHMFHTPDEKLYEVFGQLQAEAARQELPIRLHLSREYYYDEQFIHLLDQGQVIPLGPQNHLLVEFSYLSEPQQFLDAARRIRAAGYRPVFAHIERYRAIQKEPSLAAALRDAGVTLQVNANAILGLDGWKLKRLCTKLLKSDCIQIIASDTHDPQYRSCSLQKCAAYLEKKIGQGRTLLLMCETPLAILQ